MMQKTNNWQRIWNDDGSSNRCRPAKTVLSAISLVYRLIINLRNWFYDHKLFTEVKLPCPVISVGNITVGGTGKTPCVIWLARMLQERGFRPAVLSRGYGAKTSQPVNIVSDGVHVLLPAAKAGDEPYLMAQTLKNIPIIIGPKRTLTGMAAIEKFGVNILVCDDAFQHRQIFRDINLVLLDSQKPFGNGYLLPRGELREPAAGISRADAVIITRTNEGKEANLAGGQLAAVQNIPIFRSAHKTVDAVKGDYSGQLSLAELQGKKICAFAGIARPDSFKKILERAGMQIISFDIFSDHHPYNRKELENIYHNFINTGADLLITTEKDGMRLREFPEPAKNIYLLRIELALIPDDNSLKKFILEKLQDKTPPDQKRGQTT